MLERDVYELISDTLSSLGYRVVRVRMYDISPDDINDNRTLQIMIDHVAPKSGGITVDDCEAASRVISPVLDDAESLLDFHYSLEVSSPGVDRPLTTLKDYKDNVGCDIKLFLSSAMNGKKKVVGRLEDVTADSLSLLCNDGEEVCIDHSAIEDGYLFG